MWNPDQYNKFNKERHRPAYELISRIPDCELRSIIDLGCGDGVITRILYDKYIPDSIIGLDSSDLMLKKARERCSVVDWQLGDITNFNGEYDLIFSNAALQWLDNHEKLFKQLSKQTKKVLAIQMPNNFNCPSHALLRETINENQKFNSKLAGIIRVDPVQPKDEYYRILYNNFSNIDIWETCYLQQLSGENAVLEWVRGTALVPVCENLEPDEYIEFEAIYNQKLLKAYPRIDNGVTLFPFSRIFIIAEK